MTGKRAAEKRALDRRKKFVTTASSAAEPPVAAPTHTAAASSAAEPPVAAPTHTAAAPTTPPATVAAAARSAEAALPAAFFVSTPKADGPPATCRVSTQQPQPPAASAPKAPAGPAYRNVPPNVVSFRAGYHQQREGVDWQDRVHLVASISARCTAAFGFVSDVFINADRETALVFFTRVADAEVAKRQSFLNDRHCLPWHVSAPSRQEFTELVDPFLADLVADAQLQTEQTIADRDAKHGPMDQRLRAEARELDGESVSFFVFLVLGPQILLEPISIAYEVCVCVCVCISTRSSPGCTGS
jgi:hypothetical protein